MVMTIVVTRDVIPRTRGFLSSVMLEVSAGVYLSPSLSSEVRSKIWSVLSGWHSPDFGSVVMIWGDNSSVGGIQLKFLGEPPKEISDSDGVLLVKRN